MATDRPNTDRTGPRRPSRRASPWAVSLALAASVAAGCAGGPIERWRMRNDEGVAKGLTDEELGTDKGLLGRWINPKADVPGPNSAKALVQSRDKFAPAEVKADPVAEKALADAEALFRKGQFPEAERAFAVVAKKYKKTPYGEKAQYYLAESYFQHGLYVKAHTAYEQLIADYPVTEYLDKLIQREYAIAETWLAHEAPATAADKAGAKDQPKDTPKGEAKPKDDPEVEIVGLPTGDKSAPNSREALEAIPPPGPIPTTFTWKDHFDGKLPMVDVGGHAIQALEHVRHHDPGGALSDDALLRLADYYMERKDYELAAIHYDQLVTDHAKSKHLHRAQLASIDAKMKGYVGPEYDMTGLAEARAMVDLTRKTFPDKPTGGVDLGHTVDLISDQEAERAYIQGDYYRRTGTVGGAEYYFKMIERRWPKSPWAEKARTQLAVIAKMPRKKVLPSKIMSQPGADPNSSGGGMGMSGMGMGGMGGGGMGGGGGGGMGGGPTGP